MSTVNSAAPISQISSAAFVDPSSSSSLSPQTTSSSNPSNNSKDHEEEPSAPMMEIDVPGLEDVNNLKISRGERAEAEIDWKKLHSLYVLDEMGNKIKFTDIYKMQKTIILFVRHFLDFIAKEYVEDVGLIPLEYLQSAETRLVVIGPAPCKYIKPFKQITGLPYTLYVDPDREVYKALGCIEKMVSGPLESSKHIKSGFIKGVTSSVWRAMRSGEKEFQGDVKQQGGAFILGPGDECHFNHIDQGSSDHCALNDVLEKAGVMNVSFPKDPRVQII